MPVLPVFFFYLHFVVMAVFAAIPCSSQIDLRISKPNVQPILPTPPGGGGGGSGSGAQPYQSSPPSGSFGPTFYSPGTISSNDLLTGSPALAVWKGALWAAFKSNDQYGLIFLSSSSTGTNFPTATAIPTVRTDQSPALAVFNNELYIAYHPSGSATGVAVIATPDGVTFTTPAIVNVPDTLGVSLAVCFGLLDMAYTGTDGGVYVTGSGDGVHWSSGSYTDIASTVAPAIADGYTLQSTGYQTYAYEETELIAAQGSGAQLTVVETLNGLPNFTPVAYPGILVQGSPAAVGYSDGKGDYSIVVTFQSDDKYHLLFETSTTATGFYSPAVGYSNLLVGTGPALASGQLAGSAYTTWVGFKSNDQFNDLFTSGSY